MSHPPPHPSPPVPPLPLSAKALRTQEQPISFLIAEAMKNPRLINLAAGLVDPLTLPVGETDAICRKVFADPARGRAALQYDTTLGLTALRQEALAHLARLEGVPADAMGLHEDDLVVTTGSQQALYLVGDALVDPGDIVIAEAPSYFVYAGALASLGANVLSAPMDDGGMDVEAVGRLLEQLDRGGRLGRVKFVYCTSYFQNPTGLTLAADRRPRLVEIVKRYSRRHRILILEDAAYRELRYDGGAERSIKSYDPDNLFTAVSHTFSKPFAPGIKLGYTALPRDLMHAVLQQKGNHDFGSASLCQHIALEAFRDGSYDAHVDVLRRAYRVKRDAMLAALEREFGSDGAGGEDVGSGEWGVGSKEASAHASHSLPPTSLSPRPTGIHWTRPHGGLYVWLTLPESADTSRHGPLFAACVAAGVLYVPGDYCFQPDEHGRVPRHHLRLSFGQVHPDDVGPGIERLAVAVRGLLGGAAGPQSEI